MLFAGYLLVCGGALAAGIAYGWAAFPILAVVVAGGILIGEA